METRSKGRCVISNGEILFKTTTVSHLPKFNSDPCTCANSPEWGLGREQHMQSQSRMKISYISVDISLIYPILVMFDTISVMTDISSIYWFRTDISWKYQVCGTRAC